VSWKKNKIGVPWKCNSLPGNVRWPLPSGGNIIMHSRRSPNVLGEFWKVITVSIMGLLDPWIVESPWAHPTRLSHPHTNIDSLISYILYPTNQNSPPNHSFPTFIFLLLPNLAKWSPLEQQHKMDGKHKKKRHL
jgi:hypothetical protein